jgi:hypothetical protein
LLGDGNQEAQRNDAHERPAARVTCFGGDGERTVEDENNHEDDDGETSPSAVESWCDSLLAWLILPCLLWIDFCLVLRSPACKDNESSPAFSFALANVHLSFFMFILSSFLYRKTVDEWSGCCGVAVSVFMLLLPEIAMNVMLALIFFDKVVAAYLTLLSVILVLSLVVVAASAVRLLCVREIEGPKTLDCEGDDEDIEAGATVPSK